MDNFEKFKADVIEKIAAEIAPEMAERLVNAVEPVERFMYSVGPAMGAGLGGALGYNVAHRLTKKDDKKRKSGDK